MASHPFGSRAMEFGRDAPRLHTCLRCGSLSCFGVCVRGLAAMLMLAGWATSHAQRFSTRAATSAGKRARE
eukprot:9863516-Alexandrium_andersonii.AAC.1